MTSNLSTGVLVVEQHAQGDPGGAGVDQRVLVIALVLGALHLHAVEIHAGDIAGLEAAAEDAELLIEIIQVLLGLDQELLGLQGLDEGAAQSEEHGAFQVELLRLGDGGGFLRAFEAQFALVPALVQIVEGDEGQQESKGTVRVAVEELELIHAERHVGIGPEEGGDFRGFGFGDIQLAGAQGGIGVFEAGFDLIPGEGSLGEGRQGSTCHGQDRDNEASSHRAFLI